MARVCRLIVVVRVAAVAIRRQRSVVVVDVTVGTDARRYLMRTGEGEGCVVVIERGVRPNIGVVAEFARRRESSRLVGWIIRARVVFLMARVAECAVQRIVVVDVAIGALPRRHRVGARQRESRAVVIESRIQPRAGVVALIACLGEV